MPGWVLLLLLVEIETRSEQQAMGTLALKFSTFSVRILDLEMKPGLRQGVCAQALTVKARIQA